MFARPVRWVVATLVAAALLPSSARADIINLTAYGTSGTSQGALFYQANPQPTGTGYIDSFVRLQRTGTESGYNTDGPLQFDTKAGLFTHSLPLNSLQPVTLNGTQYYQFLLDVNESANDANRLLSLDTVRLYLGDAPNLTGYKDQNGFGPDAKLVYDMDVGPNGATTVNLDYKLNSGSGSGDMYMYVPVSYFQSVQDKYGTGFSYVYLYSAFGDPYGSNAGFEEWAAVTNASTSTGNPVPAPPGAVLAGMGLGCLLLGRLRPRRAAAA
jgi:hypothetical protein